MEKHVVEDDILFTNPLVGKGLKINVQEFFTFAYCLRFYPNMM